MHKKIKHNFHSAHVLRVDRIFRIRNQNGDTIIPDVWEGEGQSLDDMVPMREANALRIQACINACSGVETESLEAGQMMRLIKELKILKQKESKK